MAVTHLNLCHNCAEPLKSGDWRYCADCGKPVRQPCPYDPDGHDLPMSSEPTSKGRCPVCGHILRYCPDCHRLYQVGQRTCDCDCEDTVAVKDFCSGYVAVGGGSRGQAGSDEPDLVYESPVANKAKLDECKVRDHIAPPIGAYGYLYFFSLSNSVVKRIDDQLGSETITSSQGLGDLRQRPSLTNLAISNGYLGVLLDETASLLDVGSSLGQVISPIEGRFGAQLFIDDRWLLFGDDGHQGIQMLSVDLAQHKVGKPVALDGFESGAMTRPIAHGCGVYACTSRGRIYRVDPDGKVDLIAEKPAAEYMGQPIILNDHLYAICGRQELVSIDLQTGSPRFETVDKPFASPTIAGVGDTIVVEHSDCLAYLSAGRLRQESRQTIPANARPVAYHLVRFRTGAVAICQERQSGGRFEYNNFKICREGLAPENVRTEDSSSNPGFIYANGAVFIHKSSERGSEIRRCEIGKRK